MYVVGEGPSDRILRMDQIIQVISVYALPFIFAITLREAARAYVAHYLGDNTAYSHGRLSLNPSTHIDLFGTIILPLIFFAMRSSFMIGYGKPIPIDARNLSKPRRDIALIAAAGPAANLIMAFFWLLLAILVRAAAIDENFVRLVASAGFSLNLSLFAFTLFPLPPLDGGQILASLLPPKYAYRLAQIEPYGFFIILALAFVGVLNLWIAPIMSAGELLLRLIAYPLNLLLS